MMKANHSLSLIRKASTQFLWTCYSDMELSVSEGLREGTFMTNFVLTTKGIWRDCLLLAVDMPSIRLMT